MFTQKRIATLLALCALNLSIAIALGAFGAHKLRTVLSEYKLGVFKTACEYLSLQSLGVLILLVLKNTTIFQLKPYVPVILLIGTYIFSISVGVTAFSELPNCQGLNKLGIIAPIGGLLMILGWLLAAMGFFKQRNKI